MDWRVFHPGALLGALHGWLVCPTGGAEGPGGQPHGVTQPVGFAISPVDAVVAGADCGQDGKRAGHQAGVHDVPVGGVWFYRTVGGCCDYFQYVHNGAAAEAARVCTVEEHWDFLGADFPLGAG